MYSQLQQKLLHLEQPVTHKALIGFDGYVDMIQKAVKSSGDKEQLYVDSLHTFGKQIADAAGKSAQIELLTIATKLGGNGPIMANALAQLGIHNYCAGMMGHPEVHEVFTQMHQRCTILSVGEPAQTNALEFTDGKLILSEVSSFRQLDLPYIEAVKGIGYLDQYLQKSKLIAMVDWANLPKCTQLWQQMYERIEKLSLHNNIYFFDLCDPTKKTAGEIEEVLQVISRYKHIGTTILGLNENEAIKVYHAIRGKGPHNGNHPTGEQNVSLEAMAASIFDFMKIDALLVHPVDCSLLATKHGLTRMQGKVVAQPKILTGGGDNLNAGFCFGLLNNFTLPECMQLGMASSGAYVQNGHSPSIQELIAYLENW